MDEDALSSVLRSIRLTGSLFFRVQMRAPFSVVSLPHSRLRARFAPDADHVLPFHIVTGGCIFFTVADAAPVRLESNDIIVLPRGAMHSLSDAPGRPAVPVERLEDDISGMPPTLCYGGDGEPSEALCGFFRTGGRLFNPLLDALPETVVIRKHEERTPWLTDAFRRAYVEMGSDRPGRRAMVERLTETLFLDVIQSHIDQATPAVGWLAGLRDPVVSRALQSIHANPSNDWTVESLAREANSSRSVLAERFKATLGQSVVRYLRSWRLQVGADLLTRTRDSIADVAAAAGYESEAAFGRAFKRQVGLSPAQYRSQSD